MKPGTFPGLSFQKARSDRVSGNRFINDSHGEIEVHPIGVERTGNPRFLLDDSGRLVLPSVTCKNGGRTKTLENSESDASDYEGQLARLREIGYELSGRQELHVLIEALTASQVSTTRDYLRALLAEKPSGVSA